MIIEIALGIVLAVILLALLPTIIAFVLGIVAIIAVVGFAWFIQKIDTSPAALFEFLLLVLVCAAGLFVFAALAAAFAYIAHRIGLLERESYKPFPRSGGLYDKWRWFVELSSAGLFLLAAWWISGVLIAAIIEAVTGLSWLAMSSGIGFGIAVIAFCYFKHLRWKARSATEAPGASSQASDQM